MITIYHNPRCSKSREGIKLLQQSGKDFKTVLYLENPLSFEELETLIKKLDIKPLELVRQKEAIWLEHYKGKNLNDAEIINAMVKHPKLVERPIVVNGNKAVIGRPTESIMGII
jgi:arsenate reductase (glutaredoxin)